MGTKEYMNLFFVEGEKAEQLMVFGSLHMIGDSDKFLSLTQINGGTVIYGGKDKRRIVGKGKIKIGELIIKGTISLVLVNFVIKDIKLFLNRLFAL